MSVSFFFTGCQFALGEILPCLSDLDYVHGSLPLFFIFTVFHTLRESNFLQHYFNKTHLKSLFIYTSIIQVRNQMSNGEHAQHISEQIEESTYNKHCQNGNTDIELTAVYLSKSTNFQPLDRKIIQKTNEY